jgi:RNA polymerase sigma-70 factor (ECF subfamily)
MLLANWQAASAETAEKRVGQLRAPLEFSAVYERWFNDVSKWIRAMGGPQAERDDLVQDVFLVVLRRLPDFDGHNLPGWLYQIARHRVRDFRRLLWVKHLLFGRVPLPENLVNEGASPAETLETDEKRAILERLLDKLNESERAALVPFEIDGYSGEEISDIQGVPINTVWARIHKTRRKLARWLAEAESRDASGPIAARWTEKCSVAIEAHSSSTLARATTKSRTPMVGVELHACPRTTQALRRYGGRA